MKLDVQSSFSGSETPELTLEKPSVVSPLEYYRAPAEEDIYIPPGRKKFDRDELNPSENKIELGPPILKNDEIYRQHYSIKDYLNTLRKTIEVTEINDQVQPQHAIKPAIKNSFYIKEQRRVMQHFVEPDDEANLTRETGQHIIDYLQYYKKHPSYIETDDQTKRNIRNQLNKKIPLPGYARKTIKMAK